MIEPKYWFNRQAESRLVTSEKRGVQSIKRLLPIYNQASKNINRDILNVYENYSKKSGLTVSELNEIMSGADKKRLLASIQEQMNKLGYNLSEVYKPRYIARLTRLEALKQQIYWETMNIAQKETPLTRDKYSQMVANSYDQLSNDMRVGNGISPSFATISSATLTQILNNRFVGSNYSDRIWKNVGALAKQLPAIVGAGLLAGQSYAKTSQQIRERFGVAKFKAVRLVRTENNFFHNQAELQSYADDGVEFYEYYAIMDSRTSIICEELDGTIHKIEDAVVGDNYPPMHPNCRSTTLVVFAGEGKFKRLSRNKITGKPDEGVTMATEKPRSLTPDGVKTAFEYVARKVGTDTIKPDGRDYYPTDKGGYKVNLLENKTEVIMDAILTEKRGAGFGTEIMEHLKKYSDIKNKAFIVDDVTNKKFFRKFDWLGEVKYGSDSQFIYIPVGDRIKKTIANRVPK